MQSFFVVDLPAKFFAKARDLVVVADESREFTVVVLADDFFFFN